VQLVTPPGSADEEEARLILGIAAGDRAALSLLYSRIGGPLMGYLVHLTSDYGLAEELLQDTLLAVWTSAATFAGRSRPRTWLFGVARRQAHNTLRRHSIPLVHADEEEELALLQDPGPGPEDAVLAHAGQAEMAAALARLSTAHREVLVLAVVQGLPQHDLVEILGVPIGTVKSRLHAAKRALRILLTASEGEGT
jgi:RNA polymerase sigma-70 factor (ECF subfamily)